MAREEIYGKNGHGVVVTWGRDEDIVQVASVRGDSVFRIIKMVREWLEATADDAPTSQRRDEIVAAVAELRRMEESDMGRAYFPGWHTTLNERRSVNALIAVLKRARNGAFGSDE